MVEFGNEENTIPEELVIIYIKECNPDDNWFDNY